MPRAVPRRILFVVNDAAFFLSHRLDLAAGVRDAGYDVHIATPRSDASPRIKEQGFDWHEIVLSRRGIDPLAETKTLLSLVRLYSRVAPELVHHVTAKPILYGGVAARLARVPAVVHAVSGLGYTFISTRPRARVLRLAMRAGYRIASDHPNCAIIFQNDDDRAEFAEVIRARIVVMIRGSGVDRTRFRVSPLPAGTPLVVVPSRMLWDKGIGDMADAARLLRERGVAVRIALVGGVDEGNPSAIPKSQLETWQREGLVEWWGHRADMPSVLAEATIVCLPSYREGMPKALLEACCAGRPILTTDVPGCRDVLSAGAHGRLVPPRDGTALAAALEDMLSRPTDLEAMAAAAAVAGAEFDVQLVIEQMLDVYARLLSASDAVS